MKITYLKIENIRNIDNCEINEIGNIIVIAGPNGSGKSTIFEGIRLFKTAIARYSSLYFDYRKQFPDIITGGKNQGKVTLELELSEHERKILDVTESKIQGTITVNSNGRIDKDCNELFSRLFSAETFIHKFGVIEHIPSDRSFEKGPISGINFDENLISHDRFRVIDDTTSKFANFKQDLLWMHLVDREATEKGVTPHPQYIDGIRRIFTHFLDDVIFTGVNIDIHLSKPVEILVNNGRGDHEIDTLSSGQKEVLMTYTLLEKRKHTNSIILFDEPELHLNGGLERKVLYHIRMLAEKGNQFWLLTHSPEIISSVKDETLLRITGSNPNTIEKIDLESEKISVFKELGATVHIQMISSNIIYVEGKTDVEILEYLYPGITATNSFIQASGVRTTGGIIKCLNQASKFDNFFAIRDRDFLSDEEVDKVIKESNGKIHVWSKYHIENLLLDAQAIYYVITSVMESVVKKIFNNAGEVANELRNIADSNKQFVISMLIDREVNSKIMKRVQINANDITDSYHTSAARRLPEILSVLSEDCQETIIDNAKSTIDSIWDDKWDTICPGRIILQEFCKRYMNKNLAYYPIFIENICKTLRKTNIPEEIEELIGRIR